MVYISFSVQAATGPVVPPAGALAICHAAAGKATARPLHQMRVGGADDEVGGAGAGAVRVLCHVEIRVHNSGSRGPSPAHRSGAVPVSLCDETRYRFSTRLGKMRLQVGQSCRL